MCSRYLSFRVLEPDSTRFSSQASREQLSRPERARHDSRPAGFGDRLLGLSGKAPQSGLPMLGGQCEITLGN